MRKCWKYIVIPAILLALFLRIPKIPGWKAQEEMPLNQQIAVKREILRAAEFLTSEDDLISAGYPVIDTDGNYPEYLTNSIGLRSFVAGEEDSFGFFRVWEDKTRYLHFWRNKEDIFFFTADLVWEDGQMMIGETMLMPVYDMELSDWEIFYYQLYPSDPHYIDYSQIRLTPPNREMYDLARKYIVPVGYQMVNLFLVDWKEGDWGELSLCDTLDALYCMKYGKTLPREEFLLGNGIHRRFIPAEIFEETILSYFSLSTEELKKICGYTDEGYPWRFVHGDDLTSWEYPICDPQVTEISDNGDGTLTLTVQVYSPELKTNRLFCHELTIRPLEGEAFQYVSNEITYISERGLPPHMPRFDLNG